MRSPEVIKAVFDDLEALGRATETDDPNAVHTRTIAMRHLLAWIMEAKGAGVPVGIALGELAETHPVLTEPNPNPSSLSVFNLFQFGDHAAHQYAPHGWGFPSEPGSYRVRVNSWGDKKIPDIKTLRAVFGLALKSAKDLREKAQLPWVSPTLTYTETKTLVEDLQNQGCVVGAKLVEQL